MHKLYQTTKVEHDQPIEGVVTGDIPDWVKGSLYRNGPGIYEFGEDKFNHLFDPMAMFQRFHIANKKVTYQSRYLRGDTFKKNMAAQRIVVYGFGTLPVADPCKNIFQRFLSYFEEGEKNDNTIVNFFPLGEEMYSCSETNFIHKIDRETLDTVEKVNLTESIPALNSATAHPHVDPDGTIHNIGHAYREKGGPRICLVKIPPKSAPSDPFPKGTMMSSLKCEAKMSVNYLHSFAVTENFYVYIEQPMFINIVKILTSKVRGEPINKAIEYYPDINARFRIVSKATGEEVNPDIRYEAAPFMVFHHINAYEENDQIVMDLCGFKTQDPLNYIYLKDLTSEQCEANWRKIEEPEARRYVIPLKTDGKAVGENLVTLRTMATAMSREDDVVFCTWETLAEVGFEFPQINYNNYNGRKYRYTYGIGWHNSGPCFHSICKIDTQTKTFVEWQEEKHYPSEPVFIANPNGESEDDGVVLSAVNCSDFDCGKGAFLLVLDGKTMTELARVKFNIQRFPKDFHGIFMPSE